MRVPSEHLGKSLDLADSTLVMLLHDMAFKWADGCPKTYSMLLQDLFSSNGIPPVIIPASLKDLRRLPSAAQRVREISAAIDQESCPILPQNENVPQTDNSRPEITIKSEPGPSEPDRGDIPEAEVSPTYFPDNNALIKIKSAPFPCKNSIPEANNSSFCPEPSLTAPLPCDRNIPETENSSPCSPESLQTSSYNIQTERSICAGNSPIKEPGLKSVRSNKRKSTFTTEDGPILSRGTKRRNTVPDAYNLPPGASNHFLSDHEHDAPVSTSAPATSAKSSVQSKVVFYLIPDFITRINTASDVPPKKQIQNFPYIPHGGDYKTTPIRAHMFITSNNYSIVDNRTLTIMDNASDKIYLDNILISDILLSLNKKNKQPLTIVISPKNNPNKCLGKIHAPYGIKRADKNNFVFLIFNWAKENGFTTVELFPNSKSTTRTPSTHNN